MAAKPASEVRKGDLLVFRASNGVTFAHVTGLAKREDDAGKPMIGFYVTLGREVALPDIQWRTKFWTLWHYPTDQVELYDRRDLRRPLR